MISNNYLPPSLASVRTALASCHAVEDSTSAPSTSISAAPGAIRAPFPLCRAPQRLLRGEATQAQAARHEVGEDAASLRHLSDEEFARLAETRLKLPQHNLNYHDNQAILR